MPVYPLTEGLHQRQTRKMLKGIVDSWADRVPDFLPAEIKSRCRLLPLPQAIAQAHYPDSIELQDKARVRLAFDELFLLQLGVLSKKRDWQESQPGTPININQKILDSFLASLPFKLTAAQQKVLNEILGDMQKKCRHVPPAAGRSSAAVKPWSPRPHCLPLSPTAIRPL